jgi:hypothetical protein
MLQNPLTVELSCRHRDRDLGVAARTYGAERSEAFAEVPSR